MTDMRKAENKLYRAMLAKAELELRLLKTTTPPHNEKTLRRNARKKVDQASLELEILQHKAMVVATSTPKKQKR